jgi:heptosyltransferase-1
MFEAGKTASRILMVRLGAMGDIIHTLPAAASLRASFPNARITWVVEPQWAPLLEGNPSIDRVLTLRWDAGGIFQSLGELRREGYDLAIDFQGLIKSAVVGRLARPERLLGFRRGIARESPATLFYGKAVDSGSTHMVEMRLDLAAAAGATKRVRTFPLPEGRPEGALPRGEFVLASPLAGWRSKQWPMEHYRALAERLRADVGVPLVLNGPPAALRELSSVRGALPHISGIRGLIHATRRATAVVGVDSGPLHLAAALDKPGVAIFGPTDPARNGPYSDALQVLRAPGAATTYRRGGEPDDAMRQVRPELVFDALKAACLA